MLIAVLLFSETAIAKLAARRVTPENIRQVADSDRIVMRNPRPRLAGSVLLVGPTSGGRMLTVVLNPEAGDEGSCDVRTAWESSTAQIRRYQRDR